MGLHGTDQSCQMVSGILSKGIKCQSHGTHGVSFSPKQFAGGSSVFPADRVAFSRSRYWGLGTCFRASGIGARCVFEHAAVSAFQAFLAKLPAKGPLRSTFPD